MTAPSSPPPVPARANDCQTLHLRTYSEHDQFLVMLEMAHAPDGAEWPQMVIDLNRLRDEVRACQGAEAAP